MAWFIPRAVSAVGCLGACTPSQHCNDCADIGDIDTLRQVLRSSIGSRVIAFYPLQQLHTLEKDLVSACDLLGVGAEYARVVGSEYTR